MNAQPPLSPFLNHFERGARALEKGQLSEAETHWNKAVAENPALWGALANKTLTSGDLQSAIALYSQIVDARDIAPKIKALSLNDIGMAFSRLGNREMAVRCWDEAFRLLPRGSFEILANMGLASAWAGNFQKKIKYLEAATRLKPNFHDAHFARATALLTIGNYKDGFREYEARWKGRATKLKKLKLPIPELQHPHQVAGKSIFVYAEQGAGDTLQMLRYLPELRKAGAHQIAAWVQPGLLTLLNHSNLADWATDVFDQDAPPIDFPSCHYALPFMSLPRVFGTTLETIPPAPYMPIPEPLRLDGSFRVGLVWAGSADHNDDHWRSVPLKAFEPIILKNSDCTFYSLQVGTRAIETKFHDFPIRELDLSNYMLTARAIGAMDVIISVDTSVVHLAGAMGKRCWMLTPFCPDWRWLLDRTDSPWYPSLTLFRQPRPDDWAYPIDRIAGFARLAIQHSARASRIQSQ